MRSRSGGTGELTGAVLDGRYRIIEPIAQGAMGVVYRAERLHLGRTVAIKVMHDELPNELASRKRFEIEALAMARLEHPHCAAVLDAGFHGDKPYVVMDFVSGTNLRDVLTSGPLAIPRAVELMRQVLSGLAHAHELGIIHRDIKPANIMLSQKAGLGEHVKILDFGLARFVNADASVSAGIVVGTPSYMSPEQIQGGAIDHRTDLYACGVMLFELVTGQKPFDSPRQDPLEICAMHLRVAAPRLDHAVPGTDFGVLETVVARALAKSPDARYGSAQEFATALTELTDQPMSAPPAAGTRRSGTITATASGWTLPTHPGTETRTAPAMPPEPTPPAQDLQVLPSGSPFGAPHRASIRQAERPSDPVLQPPRRRGPIVVVAITGLTAIAIIAAVASTSDETSPPAPEGRVATMPERPVIDTATAQLLRAEQLVQSGKTEQALEHLLAARRIFPEHAQIAYETGKLYFTKLWYSHGLRQLREAIRLDPSYREDPDLIKLVLRAFIAAPEYPADLAQFLRAHIGAPARPYLEETAASHPRSSTRARAKAELKRLTP